MSEFEECDQPIDKGLKVCKHGPTTMELVAAATAGKAIRVPLNGESPRDVQMRFTNRFSRDRRWRCRTRRDGESFIVWLEPREAK